MITPAPVARPWRDVVRVGDDALGAKQRGEARNDILSNHGTVYARKFIDGSTTRR